MHINFFDGKKIHYFVAASFFFLFSQFSLSAEQSECDEKKRAGDRACATTQTNVYSYERERECRWSVDQEYQSCLATVPPYEEVPPVHPDGTNHLDYAGGMSGMPFAPLDDLVGGGGWGVGANGPPAQLGSPNDTSDCPVVKSTGEKFFEDADYRGIGLNPLFVTRYHRQDPAEGRGLFGSAWTSNLDVTMTLWLKTSDNEAVLCALGANNDKCNQAGLKFYAATIRMPGALGKRTDIRFDEKSGGGVGDAEEVYYLSNLPDSAKPVKFFQLLRQNIGKEEESYVYFDSSAKKWTFDRRGRLTSMSMGVGSPWNIFYGAYNRVDYVEHGGEKTYFYYSPIASKSNYDWVVTSIKLPNSKTIDYAYEAYDFTTAEPNTYSVALLTKVSYPGAVGDKGTIAYHYDWWRPESSTRARKVLTKKFIDGAQWGDYVYYPPETVAPAGQEEEPKVKKSGLVGGVNQTHFEYIPNTENPNVNTTIVTTNAKGGTTTYTYDVEGRSHSTLRASGACPASRVATFYDELGNVKKSQDSLGNTSYYKWYENGLGLHQKFERGVTTVYERNNYGQPTRIDIYAGLTTGMSWVSDVLMISSMPTKTITFDYSASTCGFGVPSRTGSAAMDWSRSKLSAWRYTSYTCSSDRASISVDGPKLGSDDTTVYAVNERGAVTAVTDPEGNTTQYLYNVDGDPDTLDRTVDPNGLTVTFGYDAAGFLVSQGIPGRGVTRYQYYGAGELKRVDFPGGEYIEYELDEARRVKATVKPGVYDGRIVRTESTYDPLNNMKSSKEVHVQSLTGQEVSVRSLKTILLDKFGVAEREDFNHGQYNIYTYDKNKNVTSVVNALGDKMTFTYYGIADGPYSNGFWLHNNRLKTSTNGENETITYTYDEMGFLASVTDGLGNTTTYRRNGFGEIERKEEPGNLLPEDYWFDQRGLMHELAGYDKFMYTFHDNNKRVTEQLDPGRGGGGTNTFMMDGKCRALV